MSAKVEVENKNLSIAVLVMFFFFGLPNSVDTLKPLKRDRLYMLFVGRGTTIYSTQHRGREAHYACLGLFKAVDVAYRGWLKDIGSENCGSKRRCLKLKRCYFHMHKADLCCMLIF